MQVRYKLFRQPRSELPTLTPVLQTWRSRPLSGVAGHGISELSPVC